MLITTGEVSFLLTVLKEVLENGSEEIEDEVQEGIDLLLAIQEQNI